MGVNRLLRHPAVQKYGTGVSSAELADFTQEFSQFAASRIMGTGHSEYGGDLQAFELKDHASFAQDIAEELADAINYVAMCLARSLHAMQSASATDLKAAYESGWKDGEEYMLDAITDRVGAQR